MKGRLSQVPWPRAPRPSEPLEGRVAAMEAKLVILSGKTNKRDVKLKLPTVIGRSREADLTVAHPMISRRHCELFEVDGFVMIKDLGSLNGTYVHGKRIAQEVLLRPNDEFTIGPLTFRIEYEAPGAIPEAPPSVEETPEYIPSFVPTAHSAARSSQPSELAETPAPEGSRAEAVPPAPPASEKSPPWADLEALEKEFDFDLAEQVAPETSQTSQRPAGSEQLPLEQIAEQVLADQPPEAQDLAEVQPETAPAPEKSLADSASPKTVAKPGKTPSSPPKVSAVSAPPAATKQTEEGEDDFDEIEDAALRDFLKGLR